MEQSLWFDRDGEMDYGLDNGAKLFTHYPDLFHKALFPLPRALLHI